MTNEKWHYEKGDKGRHFACVNGRKYETDYSKAIIELIVKRKGAKRLPLYLNYREIRGPKVSALLDQMCRDGRKISVLEPGCSAGHISEAILKHECINRLVSFDVDQGMIDVCLEKKRHFHLDKWDLTVAEIPDFTPEQFDLVILTAVMEHVDPAHRRLLIEACYRSLKSGGLFVVMESQNRFWPFEYHVIRLPIPYLHYLPPRWIHKICIFCGRYPANWSYEEFVNPNTGWWGTTLRELLPKNVKINDLSSEYGLGPIYYLKQWDAQGISGKVKTAVFRLISKLFGFFGATGHSLLPAYYLVFEKEGSLK